MRIAGYNIQALKRFTLCRQCSVYYQNIAEIMLVRLQVAIRASKGRFLRWQDSSTYCCKQLCCSSTHLMTDVVAQLPWVLLSACTLGPSLPAVDDMRGHDIPAGTVLFFCSAGQRMHVLAQPPLQPVKLPATPSAAVLQQAPGAATGHEGLTILLSRVALGISIQGSFDLRRPPDAYDSTINSRGRNPNNKLDIYCVYDNAQAYPAYIITYRATGGHGMC